MTKEELVIAVEIAIENKLGMFLVEREQHYQDHCFTKEFRRNVDKGKFVIGITILGSAVTAVLTLFVWGVISWIGKVTR